MAERASEPMAARPGASAEERLRAAEHEVDKVHVLVLCVCAVFWLAVFAHYVLK